MNNEFVRREACPGCEATTTREIYRTPYGDAPIKPYLDAFYEGVGTIDHARLAGSDFALSACDDCSLVFQNEIPNDALLEALYEQMINPGQAYDAYEHSYDVRFYVQLERHVEKTVRFLKKNPSELKLFDFGMGWGNWCMFAQAFGCETHGCEISETRAKHAASRGINVVAYDDIASHQFDMINAEQVFEHLARPLETLRYLVSALRPGGLIWIGVPNGGDIRSRLERDNWTTDKSSAESLNAVAPLEHLNCFSAKALVRMAECAGCELLEIPHRRLQSSRWAMWRHRAETKINKLRGPVPSGDRFEGMTPDLFFRKKV
jgi:2-polyprenyl-3-methyl-5-hydroxy-6-metoxy-1,4-benzoquinol methylase